MEQVVVDAPFLILFHELFLQRNVQMEGGLLRCEFVQIADPLLYIRQLREHLSNAHELWAFIQSASGSVLRLLGHVCRRPLILNSVLVDIEDRLNSTRHDSTGLILMLHLAE